MFLTRRGTCDRRDQLFLHFFSFFFSFGFLSSVTILLVNFVAFFVFLFSSFAFPLFFVFTISHWSILFYFFCLFFPGFTFCSCASVIFPCYDLFIDTMMTLSVSIPF